MTALHWAAKLGFDNIAYILITRGSDLEAVDMV